jgi:glycine cleavage system transcriptional repressor
MLVAGATFDYAVPIDGRHRAGRRPGGGSSMATYIVTVTSSDTVGIVHAVTGALHDQGGNILELSQTVMRGFFTIILAVEFKEPQDRRALQDLINRAGERFNLTVVVLDASSCPATTPVPRGERFILTVLGADRPGNIRGIAGRLACRGVNIVDLHARTEGARFSLVMEAFLPPDLPPAEVRAELERYGREQGLEAFVQHENIFLATSEPSPVRISVIHSITGSSQVPH